MSEICVSHEISIFHPGIILASGQNRKFLDTFQIITVSFKSTSQTYPVSDFSDVDSFFKLTVLSNSFSPFGKS